MKRLCGLALILILFVFPHYGEGQATRAGVQVEISSLKPLRLHVTLRSGADKRVVIDKGQLPWATRYGMVLVAVKTDSQCLEKVLPVEDPGVGKISLEPRQVLTGDVELEGIFKGIDEARKKSDVHLFWAYQAPSELGIGRWSGGWILIPRNP
jgi:hypothetical protein